MSNCSVCEADGETKKAVAEYTNNFGVRLLACKKHLKDVKSAQLEYNLLGDATEEDLETPDEDEDTKCPNCGDTSFSENDDGDQECDNCGEIL